MKITGPGLPGTLLVTSGGAKGSPGSALLASLVRGQVVRFETLGPSAHGGERIRIGSEAFTAVFSRSLPAGSMGKAVVTGVGPPLALRLTEWAESGKTGKAGVGMPALMGKEPVARGTSLAAHLEDWNASLRKLVPADGGPVSPERFREGVLLARFLVFALATSGEKTPAVRDGARREDGPGGASRADAGPENPFWFFVPFPGEKGPVVFPGYRRREEEDSSPAWGFFLGFPDVGAVSARFLPAREGWRIALLAEDENLARALSAGAGAFSRTLRSGGFRLLDVTVAKMPKGRLEAEVGARLSRDAGIPLVEKIA